MKIKNTSPGPRMVNTKVGDAIVPVTLQPGQSRDDLEIADAEGAIFKAMVEEGDLEIDGEEEPVVRPLTTNTDDPAGPDAVRAAGLDSDRLTPPAQLGGDGGPKQLPTVNEQGGALTPQQEEAGRKEQPPMAARKPVEQTPEQKAQASGEQKPKEEPHRARRKE